MTRHTRRGRALTAVVASLCLVGFAPSVSQAAGQSCGGGATLTVDVDGTPHTVTAAELCAAADVFDTTYQTRGVPRGTIQDTPQVQQGTSVRALLASLNPGVDPDSVDFVNVARADGTWTTLSGDDLADPSDFKSGLQPVFFVDGSRIDYFRPLYAGSNDTNARDFILGPADGSLEVGAHAGPLLTVTATARTSKVVTGEPVRFAATVAGGTSASAPYRFSWTFGDGGTGSGRTVNHPFSATGTYDAQVSVSGADHSGGVSPQLQVVVGKPPKGGTGPGGGGSHNPHHPATGPTGGHGHRGGGRPSHHRHPGHSADGTGNGDGNGSRFGITLPALPPDLRHHIVPDTTSVGANPRLANRLPSVTGQLIDGGITLSAEQTAVVARATAPAARLGGQSMRIGAGLAGGVTAVVLLLLGMVRELRGSQRRPERTR